MGMTALIIWYLS